MGRSLKISVLLRHSSLSLLYAVLILATLVGVAQIGQTSENVEVPLTVENALDQPRIQEPVTSGIPLPKKAGITDPSSLVLCNPQGTPVPAQFTVTARWDGTPQDNRQPIRWVLVDFQADVPAHSSAVYTLRNQGSNPAPAQAIAIQDAAQEVLVDNGALQISLSKENFFLVNRLNAGSIPLISPSQTSGGMFLTDFDGTVYATAFGAPDSVVVEEAGPMRAVVAVKGLFRDARKQPMPARNVAPLNGSRENGMQPTTEGDRGLIAYTIRYHVYAGKNFVRMNCTLTNHGRYAWGEDEFNLPEPGQWIFIRSLELRLPFLPGSSSSTVRIEDGEEIPLSSGQAVRLVQRHDLNDPVDESKNFSYAVTRDGAGMGSGERSRGWMEWIVDQSRVGVIVRDFWQNHPAALSASADTLTVELLPSGFRCPENNTANGTGRDKFYRHPDTYQFEGSRQKTWDTLWVFAKSGAPDTAVTADAFQHPLFARAPADWYTRTGAWKPWGPGEIITPDSTQNAALERYNALQQTNVDTAYSDAAYRESIFTQREKRAETFAGTADHYGAFHFGDLPWAESYCNLHYDWTESMYIHYLRLGNPEFRQAAEEMLRFRRDWGQKWGEQSSASGNHAWYNNWSRYEKGAHGDLEGWPHGERNAVPAHTWNGGLALGYLLTGDRLALDAAGQNGKAVHRWFEEVYDIRNQPADPQDGSLLEIRIPGWSILNLLNLYRITHNPDDLSLAQAIFQNSLLHLERARGSHGFWGDNGNPDTQNLVMICYITEPLIQLHRETQDPDVRDLILRVCDWALEEVIAGGIPSANGRYRPWGTPANFGWEASGNTLSQLAPVQNCFYADLLAYAHFLTGQDLYLRRARDLFRDGVFYWQAGEGQLFGPGEISPVSYTSIQYPNTQTKVHGWWGRSPMFYLYYEWLLAQKELAVEDWNRDRP